MAAATDIGLRFGENLHRARFSQEELALAASLHRTEIGLLEHGERLPRLDTLVKLVSSLALSADELLQGIAWYPGSPGQGGFYVD